LAPLYTIRTRNGIYHRRFNLFFPLNQSAAQPQPFICRTELKELTSVDTEERPPVAKGRFRGCAGRRRRVKVWQNFSCADEPKGGETC
jgi:hypothetical protein